jgi:hypothetical protein
VHGANIFLLLFYSTVFEATQYLHVHPMHWDERYEPFICLVGFLPLARLVNRGLSLMDAAALMTLMDRWRPEAHTFHLPSAKITVTLQDVAMILGLPIDGTPVCGMASSTGWRDSVEQAIGLRPPSPNVPWDQKDRKMTDVYSRWLTAHFNTCPEGAEDAVVQRYVWSCVSHMHDRVIVWQLNLIAFCLGLLRPGYGIWLPDFSFQTVAGTPHLSWSFRSSVWSGRP